MDKVAQVKKYIIDSITDIAGEKNGKLYEALFKNTPDAEFSMFMQDLRDGKINLSVITPTDEDMPSVESNLAKASKYGIKFFQRLRESPTDPNIPEHITVPEYLCYHLPLRKSAQNTFANVSVSDGNTKIDPMTGQVTEGKIAKITMPEVAINAGIGIPKTATELANTRGGNIGAQRAFYAQLLAAGTATQEEAQASSTGVESVNTTATYLKAMHLSNNLDK